jgi:hypothetical protein
VGERPKPSAEAKGVGVGRVAVEAVRRQCGSNKNATRYGSTANGRGPGAVRRVRIRSQCRFERWGNSTAACGEN